MIAEIPNLLKYFIPGFIFITILNTGISNQISDSSKWIWSCVISFVTVAALEASTILSVDSGIAWGIIIWAVVLDTVLGFCCSKLVRSNGWKDWVADNFGTTASNATISHFVDWEQGSNAALYLKSEACYFTGNLKTVGDGDGDGVICLYHPTKYTLDGDEVYSHADHNLYMFFSLDDIKYMKLHNKEDDE